MKKTISKVFSIILIALMVLSSVPMTSLAVNVLCVTGHKFENYIVTKAATCTTQGEKKATCERSGCDAVDTQAVAINPIAHTPVSIPAVAATCDKYGNEAGVICGYCGITISGYAPIAPKGHKSTTLLAKAATCTEDGNKVGTKCEICGRILTGGEAIPAKGHKWELYSRVPATCTTKGLQVDICLNCGIKSAPKEIEASHSYGVWVTTPATCLAEGKMVKTCTIAGCNATVEEKIDKLSHRLIWVDGKNPTCYEDGITEGEMCSVCGTVISGCVAIPKGHNFESFEITKKPTCTEDGLKYGYCLTCKKDVEEVIVSTGHSWELYHMIPATCTTSGEYVDICKNCGIKSEVRVIEASHSYGAWVTTPATCLAEGKMVKTCTVAGCNATVEEKIDKLNHVLETIQAVAPTCDKAGSTAGKKCKVCKTNVEGVEPIPAKGHTYIIVAGKPATCTDRGTSDSRYCSVCGFVEKEAVVIAALGHKMVEDKANSKAPTCTSTGLDARKCINKDCTYTETKILPITHEANWISLSQATCTTEGRKRGTCTKCGMDVTVTEPALGHTVNDPFSWKTEKYATCTEAGKRSANCSRCGTKVIETTAALGHKEAIKAPAVVPTCSKEGSTESKYCTTCGLVTVEAKKIEKRAHTYTWKVTTVPTCVHPGVKEGTCSVCAATTKEPVEKVAHTNIDIPAVAPTCDKAGLTAGKKCSVCNTVTVEQEFVPVLDHDFGRIVITKEPTCNTDGLMTISCVYCDKPNATYILSKVGHQYNGDWKTVVAPTCSNEGVAIRVCVTCQYIESNRLSKTSHSDSNGDNSCDYGCGYVFQEPTPEKEKNFFQKIADWFTNIFDKLFGWLKF